MHLIFFERRPWIHHSISFYYLQNARCVCVCRATLANYYVLQIQSVTKISSNQIVDRWKHIPSIHWPSNHPVNLNITSWKLTKVTTLVEVVKAFIGKEMIQSVLKSDYYTKHPFSLYRWMVNKFSKNTFDCTRSVVSQKMDCSFDEGKKCPKQYGIEKNCNIYFW